MTHGPSINVRKGQAHIEGCSCWKCCRSFEVFRSRKLDRVAQADLGEHERHVIDMDGLIGAELLA